MCDTVKANNQINQIDLHWVSCMRDIYTGLAIQQPSSEPQWADGLGPGVLEAGPVKREDDRLASVSHRPCP